ncbi:MAG TPA: efflux RND transporter periplasmic adaptor subunit [Blastocatellia bacterium]|nr:efflux RND transporter periplasmic adaptor subunit [Blastocatellia bacterium]
MPEDRQSNHDIPPLKESGASETGQAAGERDRATRLLTWKRWLIIILALLGVAAIAIALLSGREPGNQEGRPVPAPTGVTVPAPADGSPVGTEPQPGDLTITLSPDKVESAQLKTEVATAQAGTVAPNAGGLRTTGTVQSNAYRETPVFPIASGIVRQVNAQLGDRVRQGQPLATIFSTELAEAQGEYLKMLAELEEHHQHHRRATELVEIGAMSREELEQAISNYKRAEANVATARQRLILLGLTPQEVETLKSPGQIKSLISVPAPVSGTVLNRTVNTGEVVEKSKELFRVADLSKVWVVGQVYESDFAKVRVGTLAFISTPAYVGQTFKGRVSYIDPRVDPNTRTAQVRVEVANPGEALRLGMFVDVSYGSAAPVMASGQPAVAVPAAALQMIGAKQVVFVATAQPGIFIQREVVAGPEANGLVPVYSGVKAGERVVTEGSFLLRAESLKLNPTQSTSATTPPISRPALSQGAEPPPAQQAGDEQSGAPKTQAVKVTLTKDGYKPASVTVRKGVPVRLTFVRQVEQTCGTEVVIPALNVKRELALNEPVVVEFTPDKPGEIGFACGMNMLHGKIVVREK